MPRSQEIFGPLYHDSLYAAKFSRAESAAVSQSHRIEPELHLVGLPFDVDVWRLIPVAGIEEKPIRPLAMNSWHKTIVTTGHSRRPQDCFGTDPDTVGR